MIRSTALKTALIAAASLLAAGAAQAQQSTINASLAESAEDDIKDALEALEDKDYALAKQKLRTATDLANRLDLQAVAARVAKANPVFSAETARFALAASSTITFENYLQNRNAVEQILKDDNGNVVRVRVFGDDRDLSDFEFIADDQAMIDKKGLQLVEMAGEPAIKRRGDDGSLSVLMMSEADHALIELEGSSEAAVMAVIEQLEAQVR